MVAASTHMLILVSILAETSDLAAPSISDPIWAHRSNTPVVTRSDIEGSSITLSKRKKLILGTSIPVRVTISVARTAIR